MSHKESRLGSDDINKVIVVGLLPETDQVVCYREMVCLFTPESPGMLKMTQDEKGEG